MSTTSVRLVSLSGLSGVSAKAHLMALAAGSTTGARLVARSGLTTGTAMEHLMAEGGSGSGSDWIIRCRRRRRRG
jgi:hypothetical protein